MLKSIDVLIGVTVVMLVVSMVVTVLTQFLTNIVNLRGKQLKGGLQDLLLQIGLPATCAEQIARAVLTHPLIAENVGKLGTVIHREELTKLLMELATSDSPQQLEDKAKETLKTTLKANGISDPEATIKSIRTAALELEQAHPELATDVRYTKAILQKASSDFVAKINGWFDQTMDRVSSRFTFHARWITFAGACAVALFLQLDTVGLVNRLSVDEALRNAMVAQAQDIYKDNTPLGQAQAAPPPEQVKKDAAAPVDPKQEEALKLDTKYNAFLAQNGLVTMPVSLGLWWKTMAWSKLPGILISAMLLSLGAPFWFNSLKNLLQMRSVLAGRDDDQRKERQTKQPTETAESTPAASA